MSTISDEIPEVLRAAYEVNLPPPTFSVDDLVADGRRRRRRRGVARRVAGGAIAATVVAGVVVATSSGGDDARRRTLAPSAAVSTAPAAVVIDTYLRALVAGDCTTAHALAASTFKPGNGELCGQVKVSSFTLNPVPATPGRDEVIYGSVLDITQGSTDGATNPQGKTTWFYDLKRQNGTWQLVGGGSGP